MLKKLSCFILLVSIVFSSKAQFGKGFSGVLPQFLPIRPGEIFFTNPGALQTSCPSGRRSKYIHHTTVDAAKEGAFSGLS